MAIKAQSIAGKKAYFRLPFFPLRWGFIREFMDFLRLFWQLRLQFDVQAFHVEIIIIIIIISPCICAELNTVVDPTVIPNLH